MHYIIANKHFPEHHFSLSSFDSIHGTYGENIYQTPNVSGTEGGTVTMNCSLFNESLGPVKWYKGKNLQKIIYSQVESDKSDTRVNRTPHKDLKRETDFTITFTNITLEDAGTYYCVKFKSNKDTAGEVGSGTQLYVNRKPSPPSISGPTERVLLHTNVTLSCRAVRFYPPEVNVTWWENEIELLGSKSEVSSDNGSMAYQVQSNITVVARINTSVTCKINHALLDQPINSTFKINNIVKGKLCILSWYYRYSENRLHENVHMNIQIYVFTFMDTAKGHAHAV
ncbi:tyrosine-protein phosphatase non-receptor type substrate 1-like [Protopterus annectens]|uniref:tyrosine-protein phosphatase non-receptor type substrate 1-like n=1 Tax=Protopterus annectens TaxID=7888 RepID=UPI001CFBA29C|nr:tyrosine-protein phosphatase non-receptor type substrate 1-like [Protopterus annectens]